MYPRVVVKDGQEKVLQDGVDAGVAVDGMSYEPLGFLSGLFHGSQHRRTTVEEQGFPIVSTFGG